MFTVERKTYASAPVNYAETARYAGVKTASNDFKALIDDCISECEREKAVNFSVCYLTLPLSVKGGQADFSAFSVNSNNLAEVLNGANSALVFACTLGIGIDRLIKKYSETDPARALIFQALGAERTETFIDLFVSDYAKERKVTVTPRFSPGYGDLSLSVQHDIFRVLRPERQIGLTLNDSLIMSPSKSVTAIAGILSENIAIKYGCKTGCASCSKTDCAYKT